MEEPQTVEEEIDEQNKVALAMIRYGGSFATYLGHALSCADIGNMRKIKKTWPEYWEQYLSMAKKK